MIPVKEFVKLEQEAREAFKHEDWTTIARVNNRLGAINTSLYRNGDEIYLMWHNPDQVLKPEDTSP